MELTELIVNVDVAEPPIVRLTVLELSDAVRPEVVAVESETVPEKLLKLVSARLDVAEDPGRIVRLAWFAEREKSGTEGPIIDTVVVRELVSFPL